MKINDLKLKELGKRMVLITGEISVEDFNSAFKKSLSSIKENINIDGFRKGAVPESIVLQKVGDMAILEDASESVLNEAYPQIIEDLKIDPIGRPEIKITKIAKDNPLGFSITTSLSPLVTLSDYKKIAKEKNKEKKEEIKVEDREVLDVILNLRKNIAHDNLHKKGGYSLEDHSHGEIKDEDLPAVDEGFLKNFGDFKTEDDFKDKIRENLKTEKEKKAIDKKRTMLLEAILEKTEMDLPEIIIEGEIEKIGGEFKADLERAGIKFEDYLKHIKKTEEDVKKEWLPVAETRAKTQLLLYEIAKKEDIKPEEVDIKREMENILSHVKDAERFRVRMYVENFLTNDLVLKFLESL